MNHQRNPFACSRARWGACTGAAVRLPSPVLILALSPLRLLLLFLLLILSSSLFAQHSTPAPAPPKATGYFHARKEADGRWWMVGPEGKRFISKGVCTVSFTQDKIQGTEISPYGDTNQAKYGSAQGWRAVVAPRLMGWGFNSLGAWSDNDLSRVPGPERQRLARSPVLNLGAGFVWEQNEAHPERRHAWLHGTFPDVFDPQFEVYAQRKAQELCGPHATDAHVLGWFTDNELRWGPDWRHKDELLLSFLNAPAGTAGRKAAAEFLQKRYPGGVEELNAVWKTSLKAWADLTPAPASAPASAAPVGIASPYPRQAVYQQNKEAEEKLNAADPARARFIGDCDAFVAVLAERYFTITTNAIKAAAPHHMVFGCRFGYVPAQPVVDVAARTLDVISFNAYNHDPTGTIRRYAVFGKPLIIGEFSFRGEDSGLPNTKGAGPKVKTQADRARAYRTYVEKAMAQPEVVGYHWFEHADQPAEGRFDGENSNYGLVNIKDEPYVEFVKAVTEANAQAEAWHQYDQRDAGPIIGD